MAQEVFGRWVLLVLMVSALVSGNSINVVPRATSNNRYQNYVFAPMSETVTYSDGRTVKLSTLDVQKVFDGNLHNSFRTKHLRSGAYVEREYLEIKFRYKVKVVSYKIFVPEDTPKAKYPRSWNVWGVKLDRVNGNQKVRLDQVKDADFDRVYKGRVAEPGAGYDKIAIEITDDNSPNDAPKLDVTIAEVRYFGPKGQFDNRIRGDLNCSRVPQYPTYNWLKKGTHFSNDSQLDWLDLNYLFDLDPAERYSRAHYPDADKDPLIIGTILASPAEVLQFGMQAFVQTTTPGARYEEGTFSENKVVLEGHKCDPTCDQLGDDGWEVLARGNGDKHYANKWLVKYPGVYKGYRVKIFRSPAQYGQSDLDMLIREVFLMICG